MNPADNKTSYGLYLQTRRVEKGVSIERVAAETRIREDILRAIEAEDHARLPDDVFVKGFLKSFAASVGADPDETLRRFALRRAGRPNATRAGEKTPKAGSRWWALLGAAVLMTLLVGGTLAIYQMQQPSGAGPDPVETASPDQPDPTAVKAEPTASPDTAPATDASSEAAPADVSADPADTPELAQETAAAATPDRYRLEIVCEEKTWLKVITDNAPASEHLLKPGDTLRLEAREHFNLLIGNAGGISVQLDGQPVSVPGNRGDVVNLVLP